MVFSSSCRRLTHRPMMDKAAAPDNQQLETEDRLFGHNSEMRAVEKLKRVGNMYLEIPKHFAQ